MRTKAILLATGFLAWGISQAEAQVVTTYRPPVTIPPTVTYAPVIPRTTYRPAVPVTTYYAPTTVYSPPTTTVGQVPATVAPAPVVTAPAVAAPAVTVPSPVTVYRPAYVPVYTTPAYVGRGILGRPTVYVPGQPIRNTLRFISP